MDAPSSINNVLAYHATPLVKIVVGANTDIEHTFHIHEGLLIEHSDFFKSALAEHWTSGDTKIVKLEDESVLSFNMFAKWVYRPVDLQFDDVVDFAKAYVVADKMLVPKMKKDALACIYRYMNHAIMYNEKAIARMHQGDMDAEEKEPITMEQLVEMADLIYDRIPQQNCGMKEFLVQYTADRMHETRWCMVCGTESRGVTWNEKLDSWEPGAMKILVEGAPRDFLCSVLTMSVAGL